MSVVELRKLPGKPLLKKVFSRPFPKTFQVLVLACPDACVACERLLAEKNESNKNQKFFAEFFTNKRLAEGLINNIKGEGLD